ncbi:MAG: transposon-encoded TnpW family protein [Clostridia bacterium]|nr:transposon-encoded TnpW family protein [Clostridia bacterium]
MPWFTLNRRIGNTNYVVNAFSSGSAKDTFQDKILHLIGNEPLDFGKEPDIMEVPQMSRQSERSA